MLMKMRGQMQKGRNQKGFTLVELMVVVVIIGILAAIAVPVYNNVSDTAKEKAEAANIRTIEGAISSYLVANDISGGYEDVVLGADGSITGVSVPGTLVPNYLKEMPKSPYDNTKSYVKAAGVGEQVKSQ